LCDLLREQEAGLELAPFQLELFNVFERAARSMLQEYPAWNEVHIQPANPPHIILVGLGRLGENLVLHMARDWWNRQAHPVVSLRITIIDRRAVQKTESLDIRYPQMNKACELIPLQMDVHSPEFERADFLFYPQNHSGPTAIYICLDDDSLGLHAGLTLSRRILKSDIPIVVRMAEESGLAKLLEFRRNHHGVFRNLYAFGYLDHTCRPDLLRNTPRDQLAQLAHEEYIRKQVETGAAPGSDASMQAWDQLDEAYRKANYLWTDHIPILLKSIGYVSVRLSDWDAPFLQFAPEQVERLAQLEHDLWCKDRLADGWRYAPEEKILKAKIHPDLVSWEHLSEDERENNRILVRNIPAFLGRAGFQVMKNENPG
jgi:hypothetical protein